MRRYMGPPRWRRVADQVSRSFHRTVFRTRAAFRRAFAAMTTQGTAALALLAVGTWCIFRAADQLLGRPWAELYLGVELLLLAALLARGAARE